MQIAVVTEQGLHARLSDQGRVLVDRVSDQARVGGGELRVSVWRRVPPKTGQHRNALHQGGQVVMDVRPALEGYLQQPG